MNKNYSVFELIVCIWVAIPSLYSCYYYYLRISGMK